MQPGSEASTASLLLNRQTLGVTRILAAYNQTGTIGLTARCIGLIIKTRIYAQFARN